MPLWEHNLWSVLISFGVTSLVAIFGALLVKLKPNLSPIGMRKMYSWTCGFIAVLAITGLFGEAVSLTMDHFDLKMGEIKLESLWVILILLASMGIAALIFYLIDKKFQTPTELVDEVYPKENQIDSRWKAIVTLMLHRIPEGIAAGFIISNFNTHIGLIIVMGIHVLPEKVIIYYRLTQMKKANWSAYFISLFKQFISFAFSILGIYCAKWLSPESTGLFWIMPLSFIIAAGMMTITIFFEIAPEFTGSKFKPINTWYFMVGVVLALIPLTLGS